MSDVVAATPAPRAAPPARRALSTVMAFVLGLPAGVGLLALIQSGPFDGTGLPRYVSHPVEMVSVILFTCALGALLTKFLGYLAEAAAVRLRWLPEWDGQPVPVAEAGGLLAEARQRGRRWQGTFLGRRVLAVLEYVHTRRSAAGLDDHLRALADNDELTVDGSYSLIRFITWAVPILGFLGTVLGITEAISGVTPEVLEQSLSTVTDGLAVAFDTTAVALALTMVIMFCSFVMERLELTLLEQVNGYADAQLAHRFERAGSEANAYADALRHNSHLLLRATEQLIQRQVALWGQSLEEARRHWAETGRHQQQSVASGLEDALQRTVAAHERRLAEQEQRSLTASAAVLTKVQELAAAVQDTACQQQTALAELTRQLTAQTEALAQLAEGGSQLVRLQDALQQNLHALAGAGAFEQAVNSLTAAIHLLTARASSSPPVSGPSRPARPGVAA